MISFAGEIVILKGIVTLPILIGKFSHKVVHMVNYLAVDNLGAYNIILVDNFWQPLNQLFLHIILP